MKEFEAISQKIRITVTEWEPKLMMYDPEIISGRINSQNRSIRMILGHLVDSASNNVHRIVHLQYQPNPLIFPDYAHFGDNDRWIAIQRYQEEDWHILVQHWKYSMLHIAHVITCINQEKLDNYWISALNENISLKAMVLSFPEHLDLHLREIEELADLKG